MPQEADGLALAPWEFAGLLLTYACNARCAFCYVAAGPHRRDALDLTMALALWRSLDQLAAAHGKTMRVHLTGGEPFLDWVRLAALVRAARDAGLSPVEKIETNAFWATADGLTRARLELLAALGVGKLVVSTDVFHQEFVPVERVQRCVAIGRQVLGRARVVVRRGDFLRQPLDVRGMPLAQRAAVFRQALARHKERLTGRAAAVLAPLLPGQPAATFRGQPCAGEMLGSRHVHIDSYGHVFPGTCLGIILGRAGAGERTVADVWQAVARDWRAHPVVAPLVTGGSHELLQLARGLGYRELEAGYASKCHLCAHVRQFLFQRGWRPEHLGPAECYCAAPEPMVTSAGESSSPAGPGARDVGLKNA